MARAYVLMGSKLGSEKSIITELKNLENVKEVHDHSREKSQLTISF